MIQFKKVEHTKQIDLIFLILSTFGLWILVLKLFIPLFENRLIPMLISIFIATIYFFFVKRKIVRISNFELFENKFKYGNTNVLFDTISEYKIHWLKGAGLKIKLKNGKIIRLSSNHNFCNSEKFVEFCEKLDLELENFDSGKIIRKKSFFETKYGYYYAVIMTYLCVLIIGYKLYSNEKINSMTFLGMIICLTIIWIGIRLKIKR